MKDGPIKICVIGLGYVGLPIAVKFGKIIPTIGYDIDKNKILSLKKELDPLSEVSKEDIISSEFLSFTNNENELSQCNVYILALPTPVNSFHVPDFNLLTSATKTVGKYLQKGDTVIYESTVYPGATEEVCIPELEKTSGLIINHDFFVGYSPERISPSSEIDVANIIKLTSGSCEKAAKFVDNLYKRIITAGTHMTSSIKIAEASKILENSQRDINIAFINEISIFFHKLGIDSTEVLEAAKTKWNFVSFTPGLVGGHCIGVDPYYLIHKSIQLGHDLSVLKSGRMVNEQMGFYIANLVTMLMSKKSISIHNAKILLMGLTYKENCIDIRNSKTIDIYSQLKNFNITADVFDPVAKPEEARSMYNIDLIEYPKENYYDSIIIVVPHNVFKEMKHQRIKSFMKTNGVLFDVKSMLKRNESDMRL